MYGYKIGVEQNIEAGKVEGIDGESQVSLNTVESLFVS